MNEWDIRGKKNLRYKEQNDALRSTFLQEIEEIPLKKLVFVDETGMDEDLQRLYGWSLRGEQIQGTHTGGKVRRVSLIAALCKKKIQAPMRFEGYCDSSVVNAWIEQCLLPTLTPGQIVIFDNASFHKSKTTKNLIESVGCRLLFLPPYSPDYNPIENFWAILKNKIKSLRSPKRSLEDCIDQSLCVLI